MIGAGALDGVKVLDLSRVLAGPWSTQILADFGADVVKIENPAGGDDTRKWGPPFLPPRDGSEVQSESAYYLCCNRNKRSIAVDLSKPEGVKIVKRLAAKADILVENFMVGGLKRYGLDYDSLKATNPRLVYCSITGFGQDGPYADRPGYDFVAQGMGGFMSITGEEGGGPLRAGVAFADLSTGNMATISILIALRHAEKTGEGQHIDISLLETQLTMLANQASTYLLDGTVPQRMGNRHPTVVPYTTFECSDGHIIIAIGNDAQFRSFCEEFDVPELADDPRFRTSAARLANREAIEQIVSELVADKISEEVIERLVAVNVPAGPINSIKDIFESEFVEARQVVHRFVREDGVEIPSVAFPGKLSASPSAYRFRPPEIGEHSREVLSDWLQTSEQEWDSLRSSEAVTQSDKP